VSLDPELTREDGARVCAIADAMPQARITTQASQDLRRSADFKTSSRICCFAICCFDFADAARLTLFDQSIKHGEFHLALQHATTHQPKVEFNGFIDTTWYARVLWSPSGTLRNR